MPDITIISTVHKEIGKCNSVELYKIIESIDPEIIFEELSENAFKRCYKLQNLTTLESNAIKLYCQYYEIEHLPVVKTELDIVSKISVLIKNKFYRFLIDQLSEYEEQYGFQFLNSTSCEIMFDYIKEAEQSILNEIDDEVLFKINNKSEREIDRYENEIVRTICDYSQLNKYDNAVLLLGAAIERQ